MKITDKTAVKYNKIIKRIATEISRCEKRIKQIDIYITELSKQERFFRNSDDKYLHLTIEGELRTAKVRKDAYEYCLKTLKHIPK